MRNKTKIFKALSDPQRLRIIKMLEKKPLCVCEITSILNLATSTVSRHLYLLREADLITDEKEGKWVNYKLNPESDRIDVREMLNLLSGWLTDDKVIAADREKVRTIDRNKICGF
jgi:ArsR family transcriptional regulator